MGSGDNVFVFSSIEDIDTSDVGFGMSVFSGFRSGIVNDLNNIFI
jgi:hypothetical protein